MIRNKGYITIKGKAVSSSRLEFEYEIPVDDANQLIDKFTINNLIEKVRHNVTHDKRVGKLTNSRG